MMHRLTLRFIGPIVRLILMFSAPMACGAQRNLEATAEATYTGALLRCVDQSHTLEESRACRREVDRQWGLVDAGGEQ